MTNSAADGKSNMAASFDLRCSKVQNDLKYTRGLCPGRSSILTFGAGKLCSALFIYLCALLDQCVDI